MRKAKVFVNEFFAGMLEELPDGNFRFSYQENFQGAPVSLTMPIINRTYEFKKFPPFFEGLLPEGTQLEALLRKRKLDRNDHFGQLVIVGKDLVGAVTIEEVL